MTGSLNPDLDGTPCSRTDCTRVADVIGHAILQLDDLVGATDDDDPMRLDIPLCADDAHLLRMGARLVEFNGGI